MSNTDHLNRILTNFYSGTDFLCHHGVKGQKWGVRNYQNPDGSYTVKGKAHRSETPTRGETIKVISQMYAGGGGAAAADQESVEALKEQLEALKEEEEKLLEDLENARGGDAIEEEISRIEEVLRQKQKDIQGVSDRIADKQDDLDKSKKEAVKHSADFNDVIQAYYDTCCFLR